MKFTQRLLCTLVLFGSVGVLWGQTAISGTITDEETGDPLIGASILVEGTSTGTVTDLDGNFSLEVPEDAEALVISYTGYETMQVEIVDGLADYDIVMSSGAIALQDIVVTGVGTPTDRRRTAISVETVDSDELLTVPSGSVDQALVGKIPGAIIQQSSGQPGQQANIILRGINSLQGTTPMIMIDGVQVSTDNNFNGSTRNLSSRLADIDFNNVERIEVVQGAAAATIYGAQGANGVIQIFTKKGRSGAPRISLNSSYGISSPLLGNFNYADFHAFQTTENGRLRGGSGDVLGQNEFGVWSAPVFEAGDDVLTDNPYVEDIYDHAETVFRNDVGNYRSSLSISGGSDNITYNVTGTFNNQESAIRGRNQRFNLGTRLGFQIFNAVDVNFGVSLIRGNNNTGAITGTNNVFSALGSVATTYPFINFNFRNENGDLVANPTGDNSVNPLYTETYRRRETDINRVIPNLNLAYEVTDWLKLDYKYGVDYYRDDYNEFIANQTAILGASTQGGIEPINGRIEQRLREGTLQNSIASAFLNFGDTDGIFSQTQLAFDWRKRDFNNVFAQGTGLPPYTPVTLRAAEQANIDELETTFVTYGYLLNQKVEYEGKVGLSAGVRADYSSAFGEGSDAFVFPRGDVYVRLSEFDFWSEAKASVPELKVRAAYGQAGVQPDAFDRIRTLDAGQLGQRGFLSPQLDQTNPLLEVQQSEEIEFGLDASFTPGDRVDGWFYFFKLGVTYWNRTSDDVIREIGVAPSTGAATLLTNAITLKSDGWQASLQKSVLETDGFTWNWTTNFSRQQTLLDNISNGVDIPVDDNFILRPGELLGTFRGVEALTSLDQTRDDGTPYLENPGEFEVVPETGVVVNSATRQVAFTDDVVVIGNGLPDFNISFINDFTIQRALRIGFQLDWVQGFDIYNQTRQWGYRDNVHGDVDDPVTIGGQTGAFFNYYRSAYNTNLANSLFVEDGSFLRMRNAYVAFDLASVLPVADLDRIELRIDGFNLFTITDYTGFDPEAASDLNDPTRIGLDQYAFPNSRGVQFGLNVIF